MKSIFYALLFMSLGPTAFARSGMGQLLEKRVDERYVSIIQLIASPEKFDGSNVTAQGYLVISDEYESSLFLDENSFKNGMYANSVAVDFSDSPKEKFSHWRSMGRVYVTISGRYKYKTTLFSDGVIMDVYSIFPHDAPPCDARLKKGDREK